MFTYWLFYSMILILSGEAKADAFLERDGVILGRLRDRLGGRK
ncbi:MAG: hypothetical protein WDO18_06265 [Acidobacteriota bacterium]